MNEGHKTINLMSGIVCGDAICPLIVQGSPGQHISLSVQNFNTSSAGI